MTIAGQKKSIDTPHLPPPLRPASVAIAPRRLKSVGNSPPSGSGQSGLAPPGETGLVPSINNGSEVEVSFAPANVGELYAFRKKKALGPRIAAAFMALFLVGGLAGIVWYVVDRQNQSTALSAGESGPNGDDTPADTDDTGGPGNGMETSGPLEANRNPTRKEPVKPAIERKFEERQYFRGEEWEEVWKRMGGYMVRLEVNTAGEKRVITGMIVDSRGWVITSLSGLRDAQTVGVTCAARRLQDASPWLETSDLARGIVARNVKYDLALIAINRSLVINIGEPELDLSDMTVSPQRFMLARTPPDDMASWITEGRVDQRPRMDELVEDLQKLVSVNGAQYDEFFKWILGSLASDRLPSSHLAGSPLLDPSGKVLGLCTGHSSGRLFVAVPAKVVAELVKSVGDTPVVEPFPGNATSGLTSPTGPGQETAESKNPDKPADWDSMVGRVKQYLEACRDMDWTASSVEQYRAFQQLSESLYSLREMTLATRDRELFRDRDKQINDIYDEFVETLGPDMAIEDFNVGALNEWINEATTAENPWFVMAATVTRNALQTPTFDGRDAVTLRVHGSDETVYAIVDGGTGELQAGRRFLLFGKFDESSFEKRGESGTKTVEIHGLFRVTHPGG
jgi:hypothetical protein